MYESSQHQPIAISAFASRLARHVLLSLLLISVSLGIGMAGYMEFEKLSALDAFLNASMLLGGMGPITVPATAAGKLFAGCYALYSGLVFIVTTALVLTPIVHRVLHKFHWDPEL
jgi:hypothetical protein